MEQPLSICLRLTVRARRQPPCRRARARPSPRRLAGRGHKVTVLAPSASPRGAAQPAAGGCARWPRATPRPLQALPRRAAGDRGRPGACRCASGRGGVRHPRRLPANVAPGGRARAASTSSHAHEPLLPGDRQLGRRSTRPALTAPRSTPRPTGRWLAAARRPRASAGGPASTPCSPPASAPPRRPRPALPRRLPVIPDGIDPALSARAASAAPGSWSSLDGRGPRQVDARARAARRPRRPSSSCAARGSRSGRRPLRPYVPAQARGRVHVASPAATAERAAVLARPTCSSAPREGGGASRWPGRRRACGCAVVARPGRARPAPCSLRRRPAGAGGRRDRRACSTTPSCASSWRPRARAAAAERSPRPVAEQIEAVYARARARRRVHAARRPLARPRRDRGDLHMHTRYSHDCATDGRRPARPLHRAGPGRDRGHRPQRDRRRARGAADRARAELPITVIVGEEVKTVAGRGDRPVPDREDRARAHDGRHRGRDPAPGRPGATCPTRSTACTRSPSATLHRLLDEIDIFEVYNSRLLFDAFNDEAAALRPQVQPDPVGAGSDAHVLQGLGTAINRIPAFDGPEEFLVAMRHNRSSAGRAACSTCRG